MDNNTVYEWILLSTFTVSARQESLKSAQPILYRIVHLYGFYYQAVSLKIYYRMPVNQEFDVWKSLNTMM